MTNGYDGCDDYDGLLYLERMWNFINLVYCVSGIGYLLEIFFSPFLLLLFFLARLPQYV